MSKVDSYGRFRVGTFHLRRMTCGCVWYDRKSHNSYGELHLEVKCTSEGLRYFLATVYMSYRASWCQKWVFRINNIWYYIKKIYKKRTATPPLFPFRISPLFSALYGHPLPGSTGGIPTLQKVEPPLRPLEGLSD